MIANSSNCLISPVWLASIVEGDSIINTTALYYIYLEICALWYCTTLRSVHYSVVLAWDLHHSVVLPWNLCIIVLYCTLRSVHTTLRSVHYFVVLPWDLCIMMLYFLEIYALLCCTTLRSALWCCTTLRSVLWCCTTLGSVHYGVVLYLEIYALWYCTTLRSALWCCTTFRSALWCCTMSRSVHYYVVLPWDLHYDVLPWNLCLMVLYYLEICALWCTTFRSVHYYVVLPWDLCIMMYYLETCALWCCTTLRSVHYGVVLPWDLCIMMLYYLEICVLWCCTTLRSVHYIDIMLYYLEICAAVLWWKSDIDGRWTYFHRTRTWRYNISTSTVSSSIPFIVYPRTRSCKPSSHSSLSFCTLCSISFSTPLTSVSSTSIITPSIPFGSSPTSKQTGYHSREILNCNTKAEMWARLFPWLWFAGLIIDGEVEHVWTDEHFVFSVNKETRL